MVSHSEGTVEGILLGAVEAQTLRVFSLNFVLSRERMRNVHGELRRKRGCNKWSRRDTKDCMNRETSGIMQTGSRTKQHMHLDERMSIFRETGLLG